MGLREESRHPDGGRAVETQPHGGRLRAERGGVPSGGGHCPSMGQYATRNFLGEDLGS